MTTCNQKNHGITVTLDFWHPPLPQPGWLTGKSAAGCIVSAYYLPSLDDNSSLGFFCLMSISVLSCIVLVAFSNVFLWVVYLDSVSPLCSWLIPNQVSRKLQVKSLPWDCSTIYINIVSLTVTCKNTKWDAAMFALSFFPQYLVTVPRAVSKQYWQ